MIKKFMSAALLIAASCLPAFAFEKEITQVTVVDSIERDEFVEMVEELEDNEIFNFIATVVFDNEVIPTEAMYVDKNSYLYDEVSELIDYIETEIISGDIEKNDTFITLSLADIAEQEGFYSFSSFFVITHYVSDSDIVHVPYYFAALVEDI